MRSALKRLILVLFIAAAAPAALRAAALARAESPFKVAFVDPAGPVAAGAVARLRINVTVAKGHYLYRHTMSVKAVGEWPQGITIAAAAWPKGREKDDPFLEKRVEIYDADVSLDCAIAVPAGAAPGEYPLKVAFSYQGCGPDMCFLPETAAHALTLTVVAGAEAAAAAPLERPAPPAPESGWAGKGRLAILLLAFLGGLGLWLTPCVYPITPITIAVIGAKEAASRLEAFVRSVVYVLGLALVYALLGLFAASTGRLFGAWASSPVFSLVLAGIFLLLSLGMFDVYTLELPSGLTAKLQGRVRGRWGLVGLFLMGMISGTVLSPCIAPVITAAFTYVSTTGDRVFGFAMFFVMALGLGLPLIVLGTSTALLRSLPKSGEWLNTVKHLFGLLMVGAALWFADASRVIPPAAMQVALVVVLTIVGVFGRALDPLGEGATLARRLTRVAALLALMAAMAIVLRMALGTAPVQSVRAASPSQSVAWQPWSEKALADAAAAGKPALIDFSAEWCTSCKEMDETTFRDPAVVAELGRFVALRFDATEADSPAVKTVLAQYRVPGLPYVVAIPSTGSMTEAQTRSGLIRSQAMLALLRSTR